MRILHISTFSPTQCGIATYTEDLIANLIDAESIKLRMQYEVDEPAQDLFGTIRVETQGDYSAAAKAIKNSAVDVVSLQHEFGIFGGQDGEYVFEFIRQIDRPVVSTLHTTSALLTPHRRGILHGIVRASRKAVVLSERSANYVTSELPGESAKVRVIRHGVPEIPFSTPDASPIRRQYNGAFVLVSAGHIRASKGYQVSLPALAKLKARGVRFVYLILGRSQPQWDKTGADQHKLDTLIRELGLQDDVVCIRRYLGLNEMLQYIQAADVGLLPYTESDQASSGILPIMLACGRPVVATSFDCAKSVAKFVGGVFLSEMNDPDSLCQTIEAIAAKRDLLQPLMSACYAQTRPWLWARAAEQYRDVFREAMGT